MKSLLLGTVFSGVEYVVTLESGPVPQLFYDLHVPSVPNESFASVPAPAANDRTSSYVVVRGTFEDGFRTYGPYVGMDITHWAAEQIYRSQENVMKMGMLPTWTARDDKLLHEMQLPSLLADVPAAVTLDNMKTLAKGFQRLSIKKSDWGINLAAILRNLQACTTHH